MTEEQRREKDWSTSRIINQYREEGEKVEHRDVLPVFLPGRVYK